MNIISAFQKKGIKSYKKNKPPTSKHHSSTQTNKKLSIFFYTKLRKLEHFSENDQNSLAAVQYANKSNYSLWLVPKCLTPVRGSFSPGILAEAVLFLSSRQTQGMHMQTYLSGDGISTFQHQSLLSSKPPSWSLCTAQCMWALLTLLSNSCSLFLE